MPAPREQSDGSARAMSRLALRHARWLAALAICIGLLFLWQSQLRHVRDFRFDDAYISLRYAENLVNHGRLSFNADDRVDGYTSAAWTLLLAAAVAVGADGEVAMLRLSAAFGFLSVVAATLLARRLGAHGAAAIGVAGLVTLSTPGFVVWSGAGMETPLVGCLAAVALALALVPQSERSAWRRPRVLAWIRAGVLVLCVLARPELWVLAGVLWIGEATLLYRPLRSLGWKTIRPLATPLVAVAGVVAILFVARWLYYGWPLPNTYYAKQGNAAMAVAGAKDFVEFVGQRAVWLALPASIWFWVRRPQTRSALVSCAFVAWFGASAWVYASVGGDHEPFHRFYQPLLPASFAFIASLFSASTENVSRRWATHVAGVLAAALVAAWAIQDGSRTLAIIQQRDLRNTIEYARTWRQFGETLRQNFPPTTSIAVRAAGVIPWVTGFRTYDMLALNNPDVAHNSPIIRNVPGHQREATPEQVVAWRPDVIVGHPVVERQDRTSRPPEWVDSPIYAGAGYRFRCYPMSKDRWACVWQL